MRRSKPERPGSGKSWRERRRAAAGSAGLAGRPAHLPLRGHRTLGIFSHFVAINLAVGAATGSSAMVSFRPGNGSITHLQTDGSQLYLIGLETKRTAW